MYKTEQEKFWAGEFGESYIARNSGKDFTSLAIDQLSHGLRKSKGIKSAIELGSNVGNNIEALNQMYKDIDLHAIEINKTAAEKLSNKKICTVKNSSLLDLNYDRTFDLSFTSGVLIHIAPDKLKQAYDNLYKLSNKYILLIEYYNHKPQELDYRGHSEKLFRRDFCYELMNQHKDLKLVDYGFLYHNDSNIERNEDMHWFLMEK